LCNNKYNRISKSPTLKIVPNENLQNPSYSAIPKHVAFIELFIKFNIVTETNGNFYYKGGAGYTLH